MDFRKNRIEFVLMDGPPEPEEDSSWRELDPEDCAENGLCDWEAAGFNPDWGQIYECKRCGARTP